jgi:hypothetical protein
MLTAQIFPFGTEYKDQQNMPNGTHNGGTARACYPTVDHAPRSAGAGRRLIKPQQMDRKDGYQNFR